MATRAHKPVSPGPKVKHPRTIHDGNGGFLPVGHPIEADQKTIACLKAKGLVE